MGECEFSPYGEELPIGITRTREILECTRLIPDLVNIIIDYVGCICYNAIFKDTCLIYTI